MQARFLLAVLALAAGVAHAQDYPSKTVTVIVPWPPDVPTSAEAGMPGFESYAWYGMFARSGTPRPIVDKLNAAALKAMKSPEFQNVLKETGSEYVGDTPENFGKFVQAEAAKWSKVVKQSGATVD